MKRLIIFCFAIVSALCLSMGVCAQSTSADDNYKNWLKYKVSDSKLASSYLKAAAEQGHAQAQYDYSEALKFGTAKGIRKDEKKSYQMLVSSAENGCPDAMWKVYDYYNYYPKRYRKYLPDEDKVNFYMVMASVYNQPDALDEQGRLWEAKAKQGDGTGMKEAVHYYEEALVQSPGHSGALKHLKKICQYLPYTAEEALKKGKEQDGLGNCDFANIYFRKAAGDGNESAMCLLSINLNPFTKDIKCEKDGAEAFKWASKAAEASYPNGMALLGSCYEDGVGVRTDLEEARKWYVKAEKAGYGKAKKYVADVDKKIADFRARAEQKAAMAVAAQQQNSSTAQSGSSTNDKIAGIVAALDKFANDLQAAGKIMKGSQAGNASRANAASGSNAVAGQEYTSQTASSGNEREREALIEEKCTYCNGYGLIHSSYATNRHGCSIDSKHCNRIKCDACGKTHCHHQHNHDRCPKCDGTGKKFRTASGGVPRLVNGDRRQIVCKSCNGSGKEAKSSADHGTEHVMAYCKICRKSHCHHIKSHKTCPACLGKGYKTQVFSVKAGKWL